MFMQVFHKSNKGVNVLKLIHAAVSMLVNTLKWGVKHFSG